MTDCIYLVLQILCKKVLIKCLFQVIHALLCDKSSLFIQSDYKSEFCFDACLLSDIYTFSVSVCQNISVIFFSLSSSLWSYCSENIACFSSPSHFPTLPLLQSFTILMHLWIQRSLRKTHWCLFSSLICFLVCRSQKAALWCF